jgi:hypothetical protein
MDLSLSTSLPGLGAGASTWALWESVLNSQQTVSQSTVEENGKHGLPFNPSLPAKRHKSGESSFSSTSTPFPGLGDSLTYSPSFIPSAPASGFSGTSIPQASTPPPVPQPQLQPLTASQQFSGNFPAFLHNLIRSAEPIVYNNTLKRGFNFTDHFTRVLGLPPSLAPSQVCVSDCCCCFFF